MWHGRTVDGGGREKVVEEDKEKEKKTKGRRNENGRERERERNGERLHDTRAYDLDRNKSRLRPDFKAQDYKN